MTSITYECIYILGIGVPVTCLACSRRFGLAYDMVGLIEDFRGNRQPEFFGAFQIDREFDRGGK